MTNGYCYLILDMNIESNHMNDLTGLQRDLLYVIAGLDNLHGLTIKSDGD